MGRQLKSVGWPLLAPGCGHSTTLDVARWWWAASIPNVSNYNLSPLRFAQGKYYPYYNSVFPLLLVKLLVLNRLRKKNGKNLVWKPGQGCDFLVWDYRAWLVGVGSQSAVGWYSVLILTPRHMASVKSQLCISLVECCCQTNPQQICICCCCF